MTVNKLSDLLPIDDNNAKPHAYEVFGLPVGESNPDTIRLSIEGMIAKVKAAKSQTEPALWKQIAGIVQAARVTLADPEKKSRLDAKLGLATTPEAKPVTSKPVDPLAALLPPVNPMQPMVHQESSARRVESPGPANGTTGDSDSPNESLGAANSMPPGLFSTPVVSEKTNAPTRNVDAPAAPTTQVQIPDPPAAETPPIVQAIVCDNPRRPARRRKSIFVPVVMSLITMALIAMVGLLAYALFFRQESIAISSSDGSVRVATSKQDQTQPKIRQPIARKPKANPEERSQAQVPEKSQFPMRDEPKAEVVEPKMTVSLPPPPMQVPTEEMPAVSPTEPDAKFAAKLRELRSAIGKADWTGMAALAKSINQMRLAPEQQVDADGLLSVADLATYYRTGIERAVAELSAGEDFEVKDGFRVVVVSKTDQTLTVRYNTKMPEFTFDALPLSLAHRLATFQIPADPSGTAAKAVYQAVAPKSTPEHREQAITWLREIDQSINGADRDTLVRTLQSIFDVN